MQNTLAETLLQYSDLRTLVMFIVLGFIVIFIVKGGGVR